jgi:hypothetical protein
MEYVVFFSSTWAGYITKPSTLPSNVRTLVDVLGEKTSRRANFCEKNCDLIEHCLEMPSQKEKEREHDHYSDGGISKALRSQHSWSCQQFRRKCTRSPGNTQSNSCNNLYCRKVPRRMVKRTSRLRVRSRDSSGADAKTRLPETWDLWKNSKFSEERDFILSLKWGSIRICQRFSCH